MIARSVPSSYNAGDSKGLQRVPLAVKQHSMSHFYPQPSILLSGECTASTDHDHSYRHLALT